MVTINESKRLIKRILLSNLITDKKDLYDTFEKEFDGKFVVGVKGRDDADFKKYTTNTNKDFVAKQFVLTKFYYKYS